MSSTDSQIKYIFCNNFANETKHVCKAEHHRDYPNLNPDGNIAFVERVGNRFWVCAGCERGTLEEYYIFDVSEKDYEQWIETYFFPERSMFHIKGKQFKQLPEKLTTIYQETLRGYNNKLGVLCAIGIRALLEGICANKNIQGANLELKIDNLRTILPENLVTNLHSIRFIGNEAAHELTVPDPDDLKLAIEICEDLLNYLYDLGYKASLLTRSRQARTSRQQK